MSRAIIVIKLRPCTERPDVRGGLLMGAISHSNFIPGNEAKFTLPKFRADSLISCQRSQALTISHQAGRAMASGFISPQSAVRNPSRFGKCPSRAVRQLELQIMVASP